MYNNFSDPAQLVNLAGRKPFQGAANQLREQLIEHDRRIRGTCSDHCACQAVSMTSPKIAAFPRQPTKKAPMTLRAVIFDYGLVLPALLNRRPARACSNITGLDARDFDTHYWKYRLDYDRGTLNGRTYWQTVARDTGLTSTPTRSTN